MTLGETARPLGGDAGPPRFPHFRRYEAADRELVAPYLADYGPTTSELAAEGLLVRAPFWGTAWSVAGDWLLVLFHPEEPGGFALPPVGPPGRVGVLRELLEWMSAEGGFSSPRVERADRRLAEEIAAAGASELLVEPTPDAFDYVYRQADLALLRGRRFHAKRNHVRRVERELEPRYERLEPRHVSGCLSLLEEWCAIRRCEEDMSLSGDREGIEGALRHWTERRLMGGVALVDEAVRAFSVGERLNDRTAVVHAEKADPDAPQLYAFINQRFAQAELEGFELINREQDMGDPGLRKAKRSYNPCRLEEKFRIGRV